MHIQETCRFGNLLLTVQPILHTSAFGVFVADDGRKEALKVKSW